MIEYIQECGLEGLVKVNQYIWKSRCPICGDSQKSKSKKRFYILLSKNMVICHNCGKSLTIPHFLKDYYHSVYESYIHDNIFGNKKETVVDFDVNSRTKKTELKAFFEIGKKYGLVVKDICSIDFVMKYLESRKLTDFSSKFWYIDNCAGFISELKGEESNSNFDPRLIIPFTKNSTKQIYAFQARSLFNKQPKYLSYILDDSLKKIYNFYNLDKNKRSYLFEGPLDSLFIPNSAAITNCRLDKQIINILKKYNLTVVLDNDFIDNEDIRNSIKIFVNSGFDVYIAPKEIIKQYKDINEMRIAGYTSEQIKKIIDDNTYSGINAIVKLSEYNIKVNV